MAVTITLHVFSGRPDPTWTVSDEDAAPVEARLAALERPTVAKPPGLLGMLGYRGFSVSRQIGHARALDVYVHEGVVDPGSHEVSYVDESRELEVLLLAGAEQHVEPGVLQYVRAEISRPPAAAAPGATAALPWPSPWPVARPITCPTCYAADAPPYTPATWNIPSVQPYNNCYNYANNQITNTFAQPGRAHGTRIANLVCPDVQAAATADGLQATPNFAGPLRAGQGWYVAMVIWPNTDYHWYRQDSVGCWSHKPGQTAVRNVDNSGHRITDPQTANRGPYTQFCTYMVSNKSVVIK
jgi:hypothetical protein